MKQRVTSLFLFLFLLLAGTASAQDAVTIRELNAVPQENIDQLNAIGANPDAADLIPPLIHSQYTGVDVVITAVVLTDPYDSGLASWVAADGAPGRIHVFVRDVAAATEGPEGMNMQIVDGDFNNTGLINVIVGDVIRVTGNVSYFQDGTSGQFNVISLEPLGSYTDNGLDDSIFDPIVVTTADLNMNVGDSKVQVNWDNYADLIHQKVRIEDATILRRTLADSGRPNWLWSTDAGQTFTQNDDVSLRFRNDRIGSYQPPFNVREANDPFQPPPVGSIVNVEGYVLYRGAFEAFDFGGIPSGEYLQIAPFDDLELEVTELPNVRTITVADLDAVPGADPVAISVDIDADAGVIASVVADYTTSGGASGSVTLTDQGGNAFAGEIPAQADGEFVTYSITVTNTDGIEFEPSGNQFFYRVLVDGINEIADIQLSAEGADGASPFDGVTTAMDITATVQSNPSVSGYVTIQDDADLNGWTGIFLAGDLPDLNPGDVVNITEATSEENFDVTQLTDVTLTVTGSGDILGYKEVDTEVLLDETIAEAHEGMLVQFNMVQIINPDEGFGEWSFGTVNTDASVQDGVLADDASDALASDFASSTFSEGDQVSFIQGIWWFSFGDYKLIPESADDIGEVTSTDIEAEAVPGSFVLAQNYPNPFNPVTTINYQIGQSVKVRLQVFDVLGRHVATLVDGVQPLGTYTVTFDGAGLASGLYVYRLDAGGTTQVKSMMLLK